MKHTLVVVTSLEPHWVNYRTEDGYNLSFGREYFPGVKIGSKWVIVTEVYQNPTPRVVKVYPFTKEMQKVSEKSIDNFGRSFMTWIVFYGAVFVAVMILAMLAYR
jgi:hypothetical protein